jgi:hypothetical protein
MEELLDLYKKMSALEKDAYRQQLILYINHLLLHEFSKLIQILYRIDVDEEKLKALLSANPQTDAAVLIAGLLIERQEEKNRSRESFRSDEEIPEDEKW